MLIIPLLVLIVEFGQQTAGLDVATLSNTQDIILWAHDVQLELDDLSKRVDQLWAMNNASQIVTIVWNETDLTPRMNQFDEFTARINFLFEDYQKISNSSSELNQSNVDQFVEAATSMNDGDVIETLNQMHRLFMGSENDNAQDSLISVAASVFTRMDPSSLCGQTKSRQQRVYDLCRTVVITEVKGFLMTAYAYKMLEINRNSTFSKEIRGAKENLITRISDYISITKKGLVSVPRDVYVCDPEQHSSGETFVDMSRAIQLILVNEDQVTFDARCHYTCDQLYNARYYNPHGIPENQPKTLCHGTTAHCDDIYNTEICELEGGVEDSIARLVYIKSNQLGEFGDSDRCVNASKTKQRSRPQGFVTCVPCLCTCYEIRGVSTATRGFSSRPQVTDIENNMVLTGIYFEKRDNLIQLQIEQGKLIADGQIEEGSQKLVPLEKMDFVPERGYMGGFNIWINGKSQEAVREEDFIFIDIALRKIHLDDIVAVSTGYVVTGAKLMLSTLDPNAVMLSIRLTMFNFTSGKLNLEKNFPSGTDKVESIWVDGDTAAKQKGLKDRTVIDVKGLIDPSKSYYNVPSSKDHSIINITHSSARDDVGQSTIPYFDKIMSGPMPRVALDGLGLYHRSNGESGGFIGIKTFTHDLSKYLNPKVDRSLLRSGELGNIQIANDSEELG